MNKYVGRGRRAGSPDTQELIREAARTLFLADGYRAVTMRSIAATAGVDVALVSYYFGSKQGVFTAAMALPANPAEIFGSQVDGDLNTLAERVLRVMMFTWDNPETGTPLRTIASAAAVEPDLNRLVREAIGREIIERLAERLGEPYGRERAGAFGAQVAGVIFSRYILRFEPIASMAPDEVIARLAPSLQLTLQLPSEG